MIKTALDLSPEEIKHLGFFRIVSPGFKSEISRLITYFGDISRHTGEIVFGQAESVESDETYKIFYDDILEPVTPLEIIKWKMSKQK